MAKQPILENPVSATLPAYQPLASSSRSPLVRWQPTSAHGHRAELEGDHTFANQNRHAGYDGNNDDDDDDDDNADPPPPYGEFPNQLSFSQDAVGAGAQVTNNGRVDIALNTKTRALADALFRGGGPSTPLPSEPLPPAYIPPNLGGQPGQAGPPPPRLNVVIQIVGSRGDVQPFVALGQVLCDTYGHRVRVATHPSFRAFVEDAGLEFFSIGGDPAAMMAFMVKNPGLLPGRNVMRSGEVGRRRKTVEQMLTGCWRSCTEPGDGLGPPPTPHPRDAPVDETYGLPGDPANKPFVADAIIANPPSFAHIHIAEKLGIPLHMMFTMPWSPTRAFPHPLANIRSSNAEDAITNYVTYAMIEMMTWQGLGDVINRFRENELGLVPLSLVWAPGLLTRLRIPYTYCWSPALIPKPNDWDSTIDVSGFYFLDLARDYKPDPDLAAFLAAGPPPVYIGFGSIVVDDPDKMTRLIFDAVHLAGCRALVSKGWGGLGVEDVGLPESVFMLGNVPHDWLFQRVSTVVHHGGAGTTSAGIKAGKPTVVVPFFGDQPFWGAMIARAGAGPNPIPYPNLTAENLAAALEYCLLPDTLDRARELGAKIRKEQGTDVGGQSFHNHLDIDKLRCSLAPSRAAVWRVRRSQVRLSALAADVLVRSNQIKYTDLKLYRPREYNTEDQPWDPITACVSSLTTDIGGIFLGVVADMPRGAYKAAKSRNRRDTSPHPPAAPAADRNSSGAGDSSSSLLLLPAPPGPADSAQLPTDSRDSLVDPSLGPSPLVSQLSLVPGEVPVELPAEPVVSELPGCEVVVADSEATATPASPVSTLSPDRPTVASALNLPDPGATTPQPKPPAKPQSPPADAASRVQFDSATLDAAIGTTREINRIIAKSAKTPMNFCLGLAKGFRNAPKLYNDETVRPAEKVTGLASGLRLASKEFGYGFYDGIAGLVTQPWHGAKKEGGIGFLKGVGKGIGGALLKPASAIFAPAAYTMQGIHAQIKNTFATSVQNYIIAGRVQQGRHEYEQSSPEERTDIVSRWATMSSDLRAFYAMQFKRKDSSTVGSNPPSPPLMRGGGDSLQLTPRGGWFQRRRPSSDGRGRMSALFSSGPGASSSSLSLAPADGGSGANPPRPNVDAEFEQAIQASVVETSRGNQDEDRAVEAAIRSSVAQLRQNGNSALPDAVVQAPAGPDWYAGGAAEATITDEEYQALIQQAIEQSMAAAATEEARGSREQAQQDQELERAIQESVAASQQQQQQQQQGENSSEQSDEALQRAIEESKALAAAANDAHDDDDDLRRVMEESKATATPPEEEEEELLRAMRESEKAHAEALERESAARREDEVVLEYVKRQSLAELEYKRKMDEYKRQTAEGKGKGKMREGDVEEDGEEDEELAAVVSASLRVTEKDNEKSGEPSGS